MTDIYHTLTVVLRGDARDENSKPLIDAILMLDGVASVTGHTANINSSMNELMMRARHQPSTTGLWFAWFPVRTGALGTGRLVWLRMVLRNQCAGISIYQLRA